MGGGFWPRQFTCTLLFSLQPISLSWWPLFRDAVFYILSIVVLILVRNPPVKNSVHTGLFSLSGREFILYWLNHWSKEIHLFFTVSTERLE